MRKWTTAKKKKDGDLSLFQLATGTYFTVQRGKNCADLQDNSEYIRCVSLITLVLEMNGLLSVLENCIVDM